jgi:hypothetical protein
VRVRAQFSDGFRGQLDGRAIGDEFLVTAKARIIAAEEVLLDVTQYGSPDPEYTTGDMEVTIFLSHPRVT